MKVIEPPGELRRRQRPACAAASSIASGSRPADGTPGDGGRVLRADDQPGTASRRRPARRTGGERRPRHARNLPGHRPSPAALPGSWPAAEAEARRTAATAAQAPRPLDDMLAVVQDQQPVQACLCLEEQGLGKRGSRTPRAPTAGPRRRGQPAPAPGKRPGPRNQRPPAWRSATTRASLGLPGATGPEQRQHPGPAHPPLPPPRPAPRWRPTIMPAGPAAADPAVRAGCPAQPRPTPGAGPPLGTQGERLGQHTQGTPRLGLRRPRSKAATASRR